MLTPNQLQAIDRHLRKENWLLNEELVAELTDHYVAGIEERLANGRTFDEAIQEIHLGFGGRKGLLAMEEDFQKQKFHQVKLVEWQLVRSFMYGSRWYVSVGIFFGLFVVCTNFGLQKTIEYVTPMGFFFVTSSVLGNLLQSIIVFYQNRREVNPASLQSNSALYSSAYLVSLALLLANKYIFPAYSFGLSTTSVLFLNIFLETLCIIYYIATILALKGLLRSTRKKDLKKIA